jgi:hypothetical protein
LSEQGIADNNAKTRMVPVRDEISAVGKRGGIAGQLPRCEARRSALIEDPDLPSLQDQQAVALFDPGLASAASLAEGRSFIPRSRLAQQQVRQPQAALGLFAASAFAIFPSSRWVAMASWYERQRWYAEEPANAAITSTPTMMIQSAGGPRALRPRAVSRKRTLPPSRSGPGQRVCRADHDSTAASRSRRVNGLATTC